MRTNEIKAPFRFNQVNSYILNRQGRRHYWGVQGKDYGLIESPQFKNRKQHDFIFPEISPQQIRLNPHTISPPLKSETYQINEVLQKRNGQNERVETDNRQYESQKRINKRHFKTEPIENFLPRESTQQHYKKDKKANLSLLTKNVNLSLNERDSLQIQRQRMQRGEFLMRRGQIKNHSTIVQQEHPEEVDGGRQRLKSQISNYYSNDYRNRVVRIVKKDRRNNPTFCNSLAYPLPCYRYIQ